jgi:MFS family permease
LVAVHLPLTTMPPPSSAFAPFRETLFRNLWLAAFASNVGTWMQNVGVSWLAVTLSSSPLLIALIQTAAALPALLFSYPAGVISDQTDRRKLLILLQALLCVVVVLLAMLTLLHVLTLSVLLLFVFLVGIGSAFTAPVWQAITPEVISPAHLREAVALNGVNFNLARAVGPALGGIVLTLGGIQSVFLVNAASFLVLIWGLYTWKNTVAPYQRLAFRQTALDGLRAVRSSQPYRHLLVHTVAFTAFISIVFAFLPQLSKYQWHQSSAQYTGLWAGLGAGALVGSYFYSRWSKALTTGQFVLVSCELLAGCLFLLSQTTNFYALSAIMFVAGLGWINVISTLNVLAQQYSPAAYKGRFLAVNVTVFQGSIALSSLGWGYLSQVLPTLVVLKLAAGGMAVCCAVLAVVPLEEVDGTAQDAVPCTEPLIQYQLPVAPATSAFRPVVS